VLIGGTDSPGGGGRGYAAGMATLRTHLAAVTAYQTGKGDRLRSIAPWHHALLGLGLVVGCAGPRPATRPPAGDARSFQVTATEANRAIELAEAAIDRSGAKPEAYRLIRAVNLTAPDGAYRGPTYWRLTFKRRDLVPATADAELGAGGEVFVDVDTAEAEATIAAYGE
jgi:hypothetical protein